MTSLDSPVGHRSVAAGRVSFVLNGQEVEVDAEHIELMEVLCSSQDDRCIAISVPIQFETPIQTPDELEAAFRAFAGHVVEYFADLCRDVQELRYQCRELFPTFVEPIVKGRVAAGDVSPTEGHVSTIS